jgi:SAM-dependent methyltransferase
VSEAETPRGRLWSSGAAYEPYVGRWSRLVAQQFLAWLTVPKESKWLDVGCGTGALSQTILDLASPSETMGVDPSDAFVQFARDHIRDQRATFAVGDARALPGDDGSYDAAVSGLVLNFVPQPEMAATEMARVTRAGGTVAAYVWDYAGKMEMMRYFWDAAVALNPAAIELDEAAKSPLCKPKALEELFRNARLADVEVRAIDAATHFRDFNDYWSPFLAGRAPAPDYAMSLSEEKRGELRELIRASLPMEADGSIDLIARAWAVRGTRV